MGHDESPLIMGKMEAPSPRLFLRLKHRPERINLAGIRQIDPPDFKIGHSNTA
jgi:hypothetical protein